MKTLPNSTYCLTIILLTTSLACSLGGSQDTAIPAARPVEFEVESASPTPAEAQPAPAEQLEQPAEQALPLGDAPTSAAVNATPTLIPVPNDTPTAVIIPTNTPAVLPPTPTLEPLPPTATPEPEVQSEPDQTETDTDSETANANQATVSAPPAAQPFDGELDAPLVGGEWDFEAEFVLWENPYGDCSGALVGLGWTAFVEDGPYGSSCMGENLYGGDVQSGAKSQEITFDFIAANSGVLRTIETKVGHRYQINAHAKHVRSLAPVQMSLGVDLTGGTVWNAETVEWHPWNNPSEDVWVATELVVTATGERMTILIKGFHPTGDQGGKTFVDNVSVTHLGP